jgi:hypothetical protein
MISHNKPDGQKSLEQFSRDSAFCGLQPVNNTSVPMKKSLPSVLLSVALLVGAPLFAQKSRDEHPTKKEAPAGAGKLIPVTEKESGWAAKERKTYPLTVCVASDEDLGSMGKSPEYIYRVNGKPDRLIVLCCDGCEEDFMKDPAKHVAKLDAAAKAKSGSSNVGAPK